MKVLIFVVLLSVLLAPVATRTCAIYIEGCLNCDEDDPNNCNMCHSGLTVETDAGAKLCGACPFGMGKGADTTPQLPGTGQCTVECDPNCLLCGAQAECVVCRPGYYLTVQTGTCTFCEGGKGYTPFSEDGIELDLDNQCYISCSLGCSNCISSTECIACKAGYRYLASTGKCSTCANGKGRAADTEPQWETSFCEVECDEGCRICGASSDKCLACYEGYAFSAETGTCTKCPTGTTAPRSDRDKGLSTQCNVVCNSKCASCLGTADNCQGCAAGHFFTLETKTCTACPAGSGRAADSEIPISSTTCDVPCTAPCLFCGATPTTCLGCTVHNEFNKVANTCTTCPAGKTRAADSAIQLRDRPCGISCNSKCSLCRGTANNCLGCKAGHFFTLSSNSCTSCEVGFGIGADATERSSDSTCDVPCESSCVTCGAEATTCLACPADKRLDWDNKSCLECNSPGFTRAADTETQKSATTCSLQCADGCTFCSGSATNCFGCNAGFSHDSTAKTCTSCNDGYGVAADTAPRTTDSTCSVYCDPVCTTCGGLASECVGCESGHRLLYAFKQCVMCSGGSGKAADTVSQVRDTTCNIECVRGCETCQGSPSACTRCDQAFFKDDQGICRSCSLGTGKPRDTTVVPVGTNSGDGPGECVACHPSCSYCKGPEATDCLGCKGPYQGNGLTSCVLCRRGKYGTDNLLYNKLPRTTYECESDCDPSCDSCTDGSSNSCLTCRVGYYWSGSGTCTICPLNFGKSADTEIQTGPSVTDSVCLACHPTCLRCSGQGANQCLKCPAGRTLTAEGACDICPIGFTKVADTDAEPAGTCNVACHNTCNRCTGSTAEECTSCKDGMYFSTGSGCLSCPAGKGKANSPDTPTPDSTADGCDIVCHPSCQTCSGPEKDQCIKCRGGYYWSGNGICSECGSDSGSTASAASMVNENPENSATVCTIDCDNSCKICSGVGADKCSLCNEGFYMTDAGLCQICPNGSGKRADSEYTIGVEACDIQCHSDCGTCKGIAKLNCLSCAGGRFLTAPGSCAVCSQGYGAPADTAIPQSLENSDDDCKPVCHASCAACTGSGANECLLCKAGYFRSAANTCSLCPAGKGSSSESVAGPISTDNGNTECTISCHSSCSVCKDDTDSGCLVCKESHYFVLPNSCSLCPDNTGRPAGTVALIASQTEADCAACNANCLSCTDTDTHCTRCGRGQFLKPDYTCAYCAPTTGKDADTVLASPSTDNGVTQCSSCDSSCNNCFNTGSSSCLNCAENYYWAGSGSTCTACAAKEYKPRDTAIKYGSNTADTCPVTCAAKCKKCQTSADNCLYCDAGYFFSAAGTCTICGTGRGKAADSGVVAEGTELTSCINCHKSCDKCSGTTSNDCLHCAAGHYLSAAGVCTLCTAGTGNAVATLGSSWGQPVSDNGVAACDLNCHAHCTSCSVANDATMCVGCAAGRFFKTDGSCAQCDPGFGKAADTTAPTPVATSSLACSACHSSCALCKGPNADDCLLCATGYYLSAANTCTLCSGGFGKVADTTPTAITTNAGADLCLIPCDKSCGTCSGTESNKCLNCAPGFFWTGNGVCTKCGDGKGKAADTAIQTTALTNTACNLNCDPACLVCSDETSAGCLLCSAGYFYSAAHTCSMCPDRKGKVKDTLFPATISSDNGDTECGKNCHATCRTCTDTAATNCLNCAAGFYYSGAGTCTPCELTKGKPADTTTYSVAQQPTSCSSACHASCNKCKGTGSTDCLNCNDGFYLSAAGTCTACPTKYGSMKAFLSEFEYPEPSTTGGQTECNVECGDTCNNCKDTTATGCVSCDAAHFLSAAGVCSICPSGFGKAADPIGKSAVTTQQSCSTECNQGCAQCTSDASTCLSCKAGYFRSAANACTICAAGTGGPGSPLKGSVVDEAVGCPDTCHSTCLTCSGANANQCLKCKAGLYLSAQGTCEMCPFGTGKAEDSQEPAKSTTSGVSECTLNCHISCRTCSAANSDTSCLSCRAGHYWLESGACTACPANKGKPADTATQTEAQTEAACTATCHSSCSTCGGPTANDCASCGAGHWWSGTGKGIIQKCEPCPKSRGKDADSNAFPVLPGSANQCTVYCDLCEAGCLTCSSTPSECALCIETKYLTPEKTCSDCPENCLKCSDATKCDTCDADYELTTDGKSCLKCQVLNCATCTSDPFKCTKCADKFTLKSPTECVYEPKQQPLALNLSSVSIADTPQLAMNILDNTLELPFGVRESPNFVAITMQDASDNRVYSCAELSCSYTIKNEKLKFEFNTDTTIKKGKLKIDSGADAKKSSVVESSSHRNTRLLQELNNYPIEIDGISLMKKSRLSTAAFATRVIVGILRLPFSLLVFWKFPHLAMMMDHMVTHLKVYSLMSQPYLAYVEVIFQSVSDSKILPFNFDNPFEHWNSNTLDCEGFVGLRSKNMYCSFFDNYGENIIGIASVVLTCVILILLSKKMLQNSSMGSSPRNFWATIASYYGLHFLISKIDANHLEIALMTLVAYSTPDHSSKSVIGIIFGTAALIAFGFVAKHVTNAVRRAYPSSSSATTKTNPGGGEPAPNESESASDIALDNEIATFVLHESTPPSNKWSAFFFAARYIRALLLVIFVATVRDPVDQVVLVVILESVYLVALILLDFRGSKLERLFYIGMHSVILAHLICRAVATSKTLSEDALQSSLATAIVVFLMIYVFAHVVASILVLIGVFLKNSNNQKAQPVNTGSTKIEMAMAGVPRETYQEQPAQVPNPGSPVSYIDMPVPPEMFADGRGPSVHNGNGASMQQNPNLSPVSYMELPVPPEINANAQGRASHYGRDALVERDTNRPQVSFVDMDIPEE